MWHHCGSGSNVVWHECGVVQCDCGITVAVTALWFQCGINVASMWHHCGSGSNVVWHECGVVLCDCGTTVSPLWHHCGTTVAPRCHHCGTTVAATALWRLNVARL